MNSHESLGAVESLPTTIRPTPKEALFPGAVLAVILAIASMMCMFTHWVVFALLWLYIALLAYQMVQEYFGTRLVLTEERLIIQQHFKPVSFSWESIDLFILDDEVLPECIYIKLNDKGLAGNREYQIVGYRPRLRLLVKYLNDAKARLANNAAS